MVPGEQGWSVGVAGKGNQSHGVHLSRLSLGHCLPASLLLLHAYKFLLSSGSFCFVGQEIHFSISLITWPQNWLPLNPVDFIVCSL